MPATVPRLITNPNRLVPDAVGARKNALLMQQSQQVNQLRGDQIANAPADRNYLMQQRAAQAEQQDYNKSQRPVAEAKQGLMVLQQLAPGMDFKTYANNRDMLKQNTGLDDSFLPTPEQITQRAAQHGVTPEAAYAELQNLWSGKAPETEEPDQYHPPKEGVDENGKPVIYRVHKTTGEASIVPGIGPKPTKGMKIYDREGNLLVDMSGGGGPDLSKKSIAKIEGKVIDGSEQLARMNAIYSEYKPEYQEVGTRFKAAWTGTKAFLGIPVEEKDRLLLIDFSKFRRKAIENINLYIKELTGAQMSEKEADRLRLAQPDPGENWYKGDDPITFKAKMDDVVKTTRASVARWKYYKSKDYTDSQIKAIINKGDAIDLDAMAGRMQ
jgi:hypothetical protein